MQNDKWAYEGRRSHHQFQLYNAIVEIDAVNTENGPRGRTTLFGATFGTTGVLGVSGSTERPRFQGFPGALTIPSYRDLATGRVVHFYFAWVLVATMLIWFVTGLFNGHVKSDLVPTRTDLRNVPKDALDHARFRCTHRRHYNPLQKISYFTVLFILFPLIVLTGLSMSPAMNAAWPQLLDIFGGRQTARTIHFFVMLILVLFFIVHILMVLAAGPLNGLRSMITGWYRVSPGADSHPEEKS